MKHPVVRVHVALLLPEELKELIASAGQLGVRFVYALSPGLDVTYSCKEDLEVLKAKLDQVSRMESNSLQLQNFRFDCVECITFRQIWGLVRLKLESMLL